MATLHYMYVPHGYSQERAWNICWLLVFRTGTVTVTGQYQYPDNLPGDPDAFAREPFVVRLKAPKTGAFTDTEKCYWTELKFVDVHSHSFICFFFPDIKEFVLIPQHTTPTNTTKELDALYDVLQDVRKKWKTEVKDCFTLLKKEK